MGKAGELEVRYLPVQFRFDTSTESPNPVLVGLAACYNSLSEPMPLEDSNETFREMIMPGAFTRTLASKPDVRFLINHEGLPLARTNSGTLQLSEDPTAGLTTRCNLDPSNPKAQELNSAIKRGDVDQMSFGFRCIEQTWRRDESGQLIRELRDCELHDGDCSAVTYPAYKATNIGIRNLDAANESYREYRSKDQKMVAPSLGMSVEHAERILYLCD